MLRPRAYSVNFGATANTGAVDWFELIAGSTVGLLLLGVFIGQTTEAGDTAEEQIEWYVKRASGSYTSGSSGATGVARTPVLGGDAAATFTAETNNTTRIAVGSGTLVTLHNSAFNVRAGLEMWWTPETAPSCAGSQALAIGMNTTPADSISWTGTVYVGELVP